MPQLTKSTQTSLSEINMVPFIDVVLVLLIIFMITAPILQSGIEVDVPKTHTVKEINEQKLVVTIDKNQLIYLGNNPVNIHQLPAMLDRVGIHSGRRRRRLTGFAIARAAPPQNSNHQHQ